MHMNKLLVTFFAGALAASAMAQDCEEHSLGTPLGNAVFDNVYGIQPIGFAFPFAGATYTDIHVTTKGVCYLSNAGTPVPPAGADFTPTVAELLAGSPALCPMWTDMGPIATLGSEVYINSSANRCTVTWYDVVCYNTTAPTFSVQMQIFPTGEIKYFYSANATNISTWTGPPAGFTCIVGASPGGGAAQPAPVDFSTGSVSSSIDTIYEEFAASGSLDLGGTIVHMAATAPGWVALPGSSAGCGTVADYGQGCLDSRDTFYEVWPMASFDLQNTTITMLRTGTSYLVLDAIPGTFVPPTAAAQNVAAGLLDGEQGFTLSVPMPVAGGTTTTLQVCTKGYVATAAGNGIDWSPTAAEFVAFPQTTFGCWHDYDQTLAGSGVITFEEIGGVAYVTWNGVYSLGTSAPNTFQFQFELATGTVTLVMGSFAGAAAGGSIVVGYSAGLSTSDPGSSDLSATLPTNFTINDVAKTPLKLTTNSAPFLGNSSFAFEVSNVPSLVPLAFLFLGDSQIPAPGVDLTFLGMAGCQAYTNANLGSATLSVSAGTATQVLPIPNNPSLTGLSFAAQALAFSLDTQLNLISSNGTFATIGL